MGLVGGIFFSRSMTGRIVKITNTCQIIMKGKLSQRIDVSSQSDEIAILSVSINQMLDQIETLMKGLREVSDNIAHDLRTPLSRLRARLELSLKRSSNSKDKLELEGAINEADKLLATFASLLRIARAEATFSRNFEVMQLGQIIEDVSDLYRPVAEEKGLSFVTEINHRVEAMGDKALVAQAIANVVDNAVKYSHYGQEVSILLEVEDSAPLIVISDGGVGIPESFHEKVFERLFRLDSSRSTPGSGLGLSLVGAVAKSHGLNVVLSSNDPGLVVAIKFPVLVR
jgi:signal transduction histidine kinase